MLHERIGTVVSTKLNNGLIQQLVTKKSCGSRNRSANVDVRKKNENGEASMRHVLVVDDDVAVCEVMRMGVEADGTSRVTSAASAGEALSIALRDRPDAAIVDAVMPGVHGLALARTLIGIGIPVMIVSGEPALQRRLAEAGCRFLLKPCRLSEIAVELRLLLDDASRRATDLATGFDRLFNGGPEFAHIIEQSRQLAEQCRLLDTHDAA
jgi:DNA-binding response OmpR family regulator